MPYLHLPIQSGSDAILKKMNRRHKVSDYMGLFQNLETLDQTLHCQVTLLSVFLKKQTTILKTIEICHLVRYASAFSFKYSPRSGNRFEREDCQILSKLKDSVLYKL